MSPNQGAVSIQMQEMIDMIAPETGIEEPTMLGGASSIYKAILLTS